MMWQRIVGLEAIADRVGELTGERPDSAALIAWSRRRQDPLPMLFRAGFWWTYADILERWVRNHLAQAEEVHA